METIIVNKNNYYNLDINKIEDMSTDYIHNVTYYMEIEYPELPKDIDNND